MIEGGVGKRGDDGEARQVDVSLDGEARRFQEHVRGVVVHAEGEAGHERDAVPVQVLDQLAVLPPVVEPLP